MNRIGDQWSKNKFSISDEHIVTETIRNVMYRIQSEISTNDLKSTKNIISMTLPNDEHEIPLIMIQAILHEMNISIVNLGTNLPVSEIKSKIQVFKPDYLIISSNYVLDPDTFNSEITQLSKFCQRNDIQILIGGSGYHLLAEGNIHTTIGLKSMTELFNYFKVGID